MSSPVIHPNTFRMFQDAAGRINQLRVEHRHAAELMWSGALVLNFSDDELSLLNAYGYLSERDRTLIRIAGRKAIITAKGAK